MAGALIAYPVALAVLDAGFMQVTDRQPMNALLLVGMALLVPPGLVLFFGVIRIAGRPGLSVGRRIYEFFLRAPLSLAFARDGRRTFEIAGWSRRALLLQRFLWIGAILLHIGVIFELALSGA